MTHEDMSIDDIVEEFEHPEFNPERELSMGIIDLLPGESEHALYYLEREHPEEPALREIEYPEDARYFVNPELDEVTKAIEKAQQASPAERKAQYEKGQEMLEVGGAIYRQWHEDKEEPVRPENQWDL